MRHAAKCQSGAAWHSRHQRLRVRAANGLDEPQTGAPFGNGFYDAGGSILIPEFTPGKRDFPARRLRARPGARAGGTKTGGKSAPRRRKIEVREHMATLPATKQFSDRTNRIEDSPPIAAVAEAAKLKASGADLVE